MRKESAEATLYKHKCSCLVNEVIYFINTLLLSCLNNFCDLANVI